jgi:hypothetical protein
LTRIQSQPRAESRDKAKRVLEWIACAERPVKKFEVQDGIALHDENLVLNDDTKVSKNVFDLCKPLVEDGLNGTIRFVHSSVKEYVHCHD